MSSTGHHLPQQPPPTGSPSRGHGRAAALQSGTRGADRRTNYVQHQLRRSARTGRLTRPRGPVRHKFRAIPGVGHAPLRASQSAATSPINPLRPAVSRSPILRASPVLHRRHAFEVLHVPRHSTTAAPYVLATELAPPACRSTSPRAITGTPTRVHLHIPNPLTRQPTSQERPAPRLLHLERECPAEVDATCTSRRTLLGNAGFESGNTTCIRYQRRHHQREPAIRPTRCSYYALAGRLRLDPPDNADAVVPSRAAARSTLTFNRTSTPPRDHHSTA